MSNKQIYQLDAGTVDLTDVLPKQDANGTSDAEKITIQQILNKQAETSQSISGNKAFQPNTLQIFNNANGVQAQASYDESANEATQLVFPQGVDDGGGTFYGTVVYEENIKSVLGYKTYSALVTKSGSTFTVNVLQNDFTGITFSFTNPLTGVILITASGATFTSNKTAFNPITLDGGNVPYAAMDAQIGNTTTLYINLIKCSDNSQSVTPNFTKQLFEFKVYN